MQYIYLFLISLFIHPSLMLANSAAGLETKDRLLIGWYSWDPYQSNASNETGDSLSGLDVQITRQITHLLRQKITYQLISWHQQLLNIKSGKQDMATGATFTPERAKYAYFSDPYRFEENSLFVKRGRYNEFHFKSIPEMLGAFEAKKYRIGVINGFIFADPAINQWLDHPQNQSQIIRVSDDPVNVENLVADKIDCFLCDRIVGATVIWRAEKGKEISEIKLNIKTPIHFIFSKKSISPEFVTEFNKAINQIKSSDAYSKLISWYLYPVFLLQTVDTDWFRIIDYLGTVAFAISGLIIAYRDRATLFGAFIFALLPSLGGGIIRDVIFNRKPIGALQSPTYLLIVIFTVLTGFLILQLSRFYIRKRKIKVTMNQDNKYLRYLLVSCDALGLAAFTVSGIIVSVLAKVSPLWLWGAFFAFLTGAGGGILRDMLSRERFIISVSGTTPYAEIAVIWGLFLAIFLDYQSHTIDPESIRWAVIITVVGAFITRLLVYIYKVPNVYFAFRDDQTNKRKSHYED